jgi:hypothetical protein
MVTYTLGCHELEEFIHDLAYRYDMDIIDAVTLLHSFRVHGEPMRRRSVDVIKYVPSPDDYRVDFQHAWGVALHDAKLCNEILQHNPSMEEIIAIEINTYRWLRFLSARCPDLERCIKYRRAADAMAEEFAATRAKAASMNTRNAAIVLERLVP